MLRAAVYLLIAVHVIVVAVVILLRIGYVYELEWMEGGTLDHVRRLMQGKPIYVAPTLEFVPAIYPPLYYAVSAFAAKVTGLSFLPLRLVSLASSAGCAWLVYRLAASEEGREAGWLAAGLFVATFFIGGAWFDLARVDMLFLVLLLATLAVVQHRPTASRYALAGLLLSLAFLTKQSALAAALPFAGYVLWRDRLKALPLPVVGAVVAGGGAIALDYTSEGWFSFYAFSVPSAHAWSLSTVVSFWTEDILGVLGIAVVVAVIGLAGMAPKRRNWWIAVALGIGAAAFLSRIKIGGWVNVLIPVYAVGAVLFGIGVARLRNWADALPRRAASVARAVLYGAVCVQMMSLFSNPLAQMPSQASTEAGERLEAFLAAQPGPVYAPAHGYLAERAGHESGAHMVAVWDVLRTDLEEKEGLEADFAAALAEQRFSLLVLPSSSTYGLNVDQAVAESLYVAVDPSNETGPLGFSDFQPVAGFPERPGLVYARAGE